MVHMNSLYKQIQHWWQKSLGILKICCIRTEFSAHTLLV
jgi:hypothetical protein